MPAVLLCLALARALCPTCGGPMPTPKPGPGRRPRHCSRECQLRAYRGARDFRGRAPLPAEPTEALPGTWEKQRVLAERAARRELLFHPDDAL